MVNDKLSDLVDLHVHSDISYEGGPSPKKIVDFSADHMHLKAIALADHDSIYSGIDDLIKYGNQKAFELVPAIELSTIIRVRDKIIHQHLLGFYIDSKNDPLINTCERTQKSKDRQCMGICQLLSEKFSQFGINYDEIKEKNNGAISRSLIAKEIQDAGFIADYHEAFKRYIGIENPCYVGFEKELPIEEGIKLILDAGGVPILAHPPTFRKSYQKIFNGTSRFIHNAYEEILPFLIKLGLQGFEFVNAGMLTSDIRQFIDSMVLLDYKEKYDLILTGGSDAHKLGGIGTIPIPYSYLVKLKERRDKLRSERKISSY